MRQSTVVPQKTLLDLYDPQPHKTSADGAGMRAMAAKGREVDTPPRFRGRQVYDAYTTSDACEGYERCSAIGFVWMVDLSRA